MSCDSIEKLIPLYYYGELTPEEEERVEEHLHGCAPCTAQLAAQRRFAQALDARETELPAGMLEDCRADLLAAVAGGAPAQVSHQPVKPPAKGPWGLFLDAIGASFAGLGRMRQPLGALALVAVGFFAARFTNGPAANPAMPIAAPSDQVFSTVRSVQPDVSGRVRIAYDETRRREVLGPMDDAAIRRLLLAAAREDNAAVRVESVDLLKSNAASAEVRDALVNALSNDSNAGVRLKAIEGLKPLSGDARVRSALATALMTDDSPAVRMQAVDLLVANRDGSMVGLLQNSLQRESNDYVRLKCEKALKEMNASVGTF